MGEFANEVREWATAALRRMLQQEPTPGMNPIVEWIGFLLEDGAGGVSSPVDPTVTSEAWLTWNQLAMDREEELVEAMTHILEREQLTPPQKTEALRQWAAGLLLSTLDELQML